jgi:hypothetical protein
MLPHNRRAVVEIVVQVAVGAIMPAANVNVPLGVCDRVADLSQT